MRRRVNTSLLSCVCGALSLLSLGVQAAIDCRATEKSIEETVCGNMALASMEDEIAKSWKQASSDGFGWANTLADQRQWLEARNDCGTDVSCLGARNKERLVTLRSYHYAVMEDTAGNRSDLLMDRRNEPLSDEGHGCTSDNRLCITFVQKDSTFPPAIRIDHADMKPATYEFPLSGLSGDDTEMHFYPWHRVIRTGTDDRFIVVGVESADTPRSRYGVRIDQDDNATLSLFGVWRNGKDVKSHEVLSIPISRNQTKSKCPNKDARQRWIGACAEHFKIDARLALNREVNTGFPQLIYETRATFTSTDIDRTAGMETLEETQMRDGVLRKSLDPACSSRRTFRMSDDRKYVPDQALPVCNDYFKQ